MLYKNKKSFPPNMSERHRKLYTSWSDEIKRLKGTNKDLVKLLKNAKHRLIAHYLYN